jgi:hypothetical protein
VPLVHNLNNPEKIVRILILGIFLDFLAVDLPIVSLICSFLNIWIDVKCFIAEGVGSFYA